ncbi:MAG: tyrosine-type recombinase/integrase [Solirubrobacteraceae bacterium]
MSVERVERKDGSVVWRVRWRDAGRNRSKVLGRKRDADAFDAEITRRKRTGDLAQLDAGKELLSDFGDEWWRLYAEPNLARSTLNSYATLWDAHVLPRLGSIPLRELTVDAINLFRLELEAAGVGPASVRKTLVLLQGVLQRACEWGRIPANPTAVVRKPVPPRSRSIVVLAPERVELIRDALLRAGRPRDAALVSVLASRGVRPGEALGLPSTSAAARCFIDRAVSLGRIETTKTGRRRTVMLLGPLAQDLAEWRLHAGRPDEGLVFPSRRGAPWSPDEWRNWRNRIYTPAAKAAGIEKPRPYDLRHSFVSLLIAEGHNVVEVARQAGHSPNMALDTYAHVFEEFDPGERINATDRIRTAREELRFRAQQPTLFDVA